MVLYSLIRSNRKTISIEIHEDGSVVVRAPKNCSRDRIDAFVEEKSKWIEEKCLKMLKREQKAEQVRKLSEAERGLYREKAREVLGERTAYYAGIMGITYGRIAIREQKTRWGSCSSKGNLNFNWKLVLAPPGVLDYVVVHELAHRLQMNHSKAFWDVVARAIPDYQKYRKWLKDNGLTLQKM